VKVKVKVDNGDPAGAGGARGGPTDLQGDPPHHASKQPPGQMTSGRQ